MASAPERRPPSGARTRRAVVLAGLAIVCVLVLAPQLRLYVDQQRDIAALREEIGAQEADVQRMQDELALWRDEAYIAAQARERLHVVYPGETAYVVPDPAPDVAGSLRGEDAGRPAAAPEGTWYARVWSSVEAVGAGAAADPVLDAPVVGEG